MTETDNLFAFLNALSPALYFWQKAFWMVINLLSILNKTLQPGMVVHVLIIKLNIRKGVIRTYLGAEVHLP